jgi:hypothetical protein
LYRCPYCGGNPVVWDEQFQAWICSHCASVLDDRPAVAVPRDVEVAPRIGSYMSMGYTLEQRVKALRHSDMVLESTKPGEISTRKWRRLVNMARRVCRSLGLPGAVCVESVDELRVIVGAWGKLRRRLHAMRDRDLVAIAVYVAASRRGFPVDLGKVAEEAGSESARSVLYELVGLLDYRPDLQARLESAFSRVAEAAQKIARHPGLVKLAKVAFDRLPSMKPIYRAIIAFRCAARALGVNLPLTTLCRELGASNPKVYADMVRNVQKKWRRLVEKIERELKEQLSPPAS